MTDITAIISGLRRVVDGPAVLHEPELAGNEWAYVKECLDDGWVSSVGPFVDKFEHALGDLTGAPFVIAANSGTSALHACLMVAGVEPGDEVITPALTFVATANAVSYCGAVPHFVDVAEESLGLDPAALDAHLQETTERTDADLRNRQTNRSIKAVIAMHTFGHPCDLDGLMAVCQRHGIVLIEDAAESLGSYYKDRHTGNFGHLAALSFNGNKIVTTGGGGAILTHDESLAKRARHKTTTAKQAHPYEFIHDEVGYNYRLTNVAAAIGVAQLEQLPDMLARKRELADQYSEAFADIEGVSVKTEPRDCRSNYWLNALLLDAPDTALRNAVLEACNEAGFMCRAAWRPMHQLPMFGDCPRSSLAKTEDLYARIINIPSSASLIGSVANG